MRLSTIDTVGSLLLALLVTGTSIWIAWRDVKISARLMLWIEAVSVSLILIVVALVLARNGRHIDLSQWRLQGMTGGGLRLLMPPRSEERRHRYVRGTSVGSGWSGSSPGRPSMLVLFTSATRCAHSSAVRLPCTVSSTGRSPLSSMYGTE